MPENYSVKNNIILKEMNCSGIQTVAFNAQFQKTKIGRSETYTPTPKHAFHLILWCGTKLMQSYQSQFR